MVYKVKIPLYILPILCYYIDMGKVDYLQVADIAKAWEVSDRSVRNYCCHGRVPGAIIAGKTWQIPADTPKPKRQIRHCRKKEETVLEQLKREKDSGFKGGMYHRIQIDFTYNSNHIEGSRLTPEQTRYIFETNTIGITDKSVNVNDIIETVNHFRCVDLAIEGAKSKLTESFIKQLHFILKNGTSDSRKSWFKVGEYKLLENEVGGMETAAPEDVKPRMKELLAWYNAKKVVTLDDILDFHVRFERIHPFQDGNGRVGRLIMFKECLKNNLKPIIITEQLKWFYYRGLKEWFHERGFLRETCLEAMEGV